MPARATPPILAARLRKLRAAFDAAGIDALLVTYPPDQYYLTGAVLEDSAVLVAARSVVLVTDSRFAEQSARQAGWARAVIRRDGLMKTAAAVASDFASIRVLGVQGEHLSANDFRELGRRAAGRRVRATTGLLSRLRVIKDAAEVALIRRAVRAAQAGFRATLKFVRPGLPERDVAAELEYQMRKAGASGSAFEPIVAVGARGSLPHARAAETRVRRGRPILFDWGAKIGGYCSDLTRVVRVGKAPPKIREIHAIVLEAQRAGIAAVRPGATCRDVDAAARRVIERAGYAKQFGHGLGHGIGLDIHEAPRLSPRSDETLAPGMVVTVEPGIYLPGTGGVRIEDDVLVTATGCQVLSNLDREL